MKVRLALGGVAAAAVLALGLGDGGGAVEAEGAPTCAGTLGIAVHGQHVIGDYVSGEGTAWPPQGGVEVDGGVAVPGGPGPGFHFPNGFAPGASFCVDAQSPGLHL